MGTIMIIRALVLALSCAYTATHAPLAAGADDNDCALYLTGPGRTSAYDYSLNLLKGNFGYEGQHTCITYDAVNRAYLEARQRIVVSQPKGEWKPEDFASVGELVLDISINLARTYGLTYEEIEKGLPLIDTSRTLIREVCPPVFSHVECRAGKYRRLDGLCNNLQNPTWGATNAPFQRLIGPLFADGINAPRISHTGRELPLSRVVSRTMHPDEGFHDHAGTVMVIAWGQFMDHDYTLTGTPLDPINRNDPEECCKRPPHLKHPYCNEIRVPDDDYFYRLFGVKCIDFVRGFPSPRPGCRLGSRVPFNTLTGAIDGNTVYGVTDKFARKLRTGYGGLLRMNPVFKDYSLKDLLPLKLDVPDEGCTRPNKNMYCFEAGEIRVNEQLVLTVMHTLMAREHNRVANGLAAVNPHWDDETLYQEARRINIAEIQHITYNEFLPILLGKDVMEKFGLVLEKEGYWDGYDPHVNPDVIDAFAAAAYRFGHSLLPTAVERWSKAHKFIASKRLSDLIRRPYDLYRAGVLDEYVMGLMNQVAQAMDDSITQEVTNHLFKKVGARFGMDLVSFNMQRGREFGLPGYMEFRKFCGLSGADSFQDLFGSMSNQTIRKYESIFEHPIDVDLWSGGVSERPLPGSMLGPTFACVIATQFSYSRRGDRFWYELPNQPSSFTPEQLHEVRKARLARVICDNTDIIDTVQLYPMVLPDHELNPRVPCRSGIIPSIDFSKWAEPVPFRSSAKQFMTHAIIAAINSTDSEETGKVHSEGINATDISTTNETVAFTPDNCNDTIIKEINSKLIAQLLEDDANTDNNTELTFSGIHNCSGQAHVNCIHKPKLNGTFENDTVLKYVYKKDDLRNQPEKSKGHVKNSIQRTKRRTDIYGDHVRYAASAPLIVSYKTRHYPRDREPLQFTSGPVINNAQLADFNIETLHEPRSSINNEDIKNNYRHKHNYKKPQLKIENREHAVGDDYKSEKREKSYRENEEKPNEYRDVDIKPQYSNSNENNRESNESGELSDHRYKEKAPNQRQDNNESGERKVGKYTNSQESSEGKREKNNSYNEPPSQENYTSDERGNYKQENEPDSQENYKGHRQSNYNDHREPQSQENYKSSERSDYKERDIPESRENYKSDETSEYKKGDVPKSRKNEERTDYKVRDIPESRENYKSDERSEYKERDVPESREHYKSDEGSEYKERDVPDSRENYRSVEKNDYKERNVPESRENYKSDERSEYKEKDVPEIRETYKENDYQERNVPLSRENYSEDRNTYPQRTNVRHRGTDNHEYKRIKSKASPDSNESGEKIDSREQTPRDQEIYRSSSEKEYPSNKATKDFHDRRASEENYANNRDNTKNDKEAYTKPPRDEIIYTKDKDDYNNKAKPLYLTPVNQDSNEKGDYRNEDKFTAPKNNQSDDSEEEAIIIMTKKNRFPHYKSKNGPNSYAKEKLGVSPVKIQDVDLGDFSYERIHVNDKGVVEPTKETHDNYDTDHSLPITPLTTFKPDVSITHHGVQFSPDVEGPGTPIIAQIIENIRKPININDGEIKPVVEINRDKIESIEDNSKEAIKDNSEEDASLETLLGVKETVTEQAGKIIEQIEEPVNEDVKQQFERIPLNYNHGNNQKPIQNINSESPHVTLRSDDNDDSPPNNEGTLDIITPIKYDEHLNIKFKDAPIKLPEIKLPEDILSYIYDEPAYVKQQKDKNKFYNYDEDYNREDPRNQKQSNHPDDDDDHDHADHDPDFHPHYYPHFNKKEDYKKSKPKVEVEDDYHIPYYGHPKEKDEYKKEKDHDGHDEEDVDLYEKFVRERFGKRGSFEKRSENLHDPRPVVENEKLFKTLQKVLKKTEDIDKEAKKSGDPKAGYMWTLEYGQKL